MKILYRIYQFCIAYPLLLVATLLTAVSTTIGCLLGGGKWWGYFPAHLWSKCWCVLMGVKVIVENHHLIDHSTSYVFVANHQSSYDIFSIYGYLNHSFRWMMKKSLEKIPLVGTACKCAGHIMVDRSSPTAILNTLELAKKQLKNGASIVVFPEGTRSIDGKMTNFKRGAFKLATDFQLPILPITIDGAYKVMRRDSLLINPGTIRLILHEPIKIDQDINLVDLMDKTHKIIKQDLTLQS